MACWTKIFVIDLLVFLYCYSFMKRSLRYYRIMWLKHDLPAGLSVFLVALPLCLGIALASGAPLYAGLLSGIIGGIVVSLVSGSHLAVSGPAAGLSTLVAASIISLGGFQLFLLAVIVAGLFQILLGVLKLGSIGNYFPSSVIKGMLAAIGIILISKQIPLSLGYNQPDFWTGGFMQLFELRNFFGNLYKFNTHVTTTTIIISIISIVSMLLLQHEKAKKYMVIPAPLIVVLIGVFGNMILSGSLFELRSSQLVSIPPNVFGNMSFPDFSKMFVSTEIWKAGIVLGLLATLETLLCIEAIDKLDRRNRITPVNRELIAQGVGNLLCGLLGAIPMTAVVVRGSANVDAGAKTKLSAFTHGVFLLLAVLLIPSLLNKIPYASLAAILLVTGYNLTKPKLYQNMWTLGMKQFLPFMITIFVILFTDLLVGVSIGLLISVYFIVQTNFKTEYNIKKTTLNGIDSYCIKLNSAVTFLNKVNLRKALEEIPDYSELVIDGSDCHFIDYDILEIVSEYHAKARERHIQVVLKGVERVNVNAIH